MSSVSPTTSTTPVLPIIGGLSAQQKELRDNSTKWKVATAALAAIGAAVAAAAGVAFAVFKAIPLVALAGGVVAAVACFGLAILVYSKKISPIMTPEQLLEAIKNAHLKPSNDAKELVSELAKLLPKGVDNPSDEEATKIREKLESLVKQFDAHYACINGKDFKEEVKTIVELAAELKLEQAIELKKDSAFISIKLTPERPKMDDETEKTVKKLEGIARSLDLQGNKDGEKISKALYYLKQVFSPV